MIVGNEVSSSMEHIAILSHRSVLEKILSGQKTIESRFSRLKSLPYGQVQSQDIVYFKLSGGLILGKAVIAKVEEHDNLTPARITELARRYEKELAISEDFLARKLESKYASLLFLEQVEECEPWQYKQDGRAGWIILPPGVSPATIEKPPDGKVEDFRSISFKEN